MITSKEEYLQRLEDIQNQSQLKELVMLPADEPRFVIDANSRTISIPDEFTFLGVQNDHAAETIYFEIDRYFDQHDLSTEMCVVQFESVSEEGAYETVLSDGFYPITKIDIDTVPGKVLFGWTILSDVTSHNGIVKFSIRFYSLETKENGKKEFAYNFNTLPSSLPIKETINATGTGTKVDPSDLEILTARFAEIEQRAKESISETETNRDLSKGYADAAEASAIKAKNSEDAAKASELASKESELAASQSETNAATSAREASGSKDAAKQSELAAEDSKNNAKASEDKALVSENNAKKSELNSKESEINSKDSELTSKQSEANAKSSEVASAASEAAAKLSETNSLESKNAAEDAATRASTSATTASEKATAASTSATNAAMSEENVAANTALVEGYKTDAKTYMSSAKKSADDAKASADAASLSETNSAASESAANESKVAAGQSASDAQASKEAAEASKLAASTSETNAKASENASKANEKAALASANNAHTSELNASDSAVLASSKASDAAASAQEAENSSTESQASALAAANSASSAKTSEDNAKNYADEARVSAKGYKGWFEDEKTLIAAYPSGINGDWAIIGSSDSMWVWDSDGSEWKCSSPKGEVNATQVIVPVPEDATSNSVSWIRLGRLKNTNDGDTVRIEIDVGFNVIATISNNGTESTQTISGWLCKFVASIGDLFQANEETLDDTYAVTEQTVGNYSIEHNLPFIGNEEISSSSNTPSATNSETNILTQVLDNSEISTYDSDTTNDNVSSVLEAAVYVLATKGGNGTSCADV